MAAFKDKKNGSWYVQFRYTDWRGERQQKLKRAFATKKEAQAWEREFQFLLALAAPVGIAELHIPRTVFLVLKRCHAIPSFPAVLSFHRTSHGRTCGRSCQQW